MCWSAPPKSARCARWAYAAPAFGGCSWLREPCWVLWARRLAWYWRSSRSRWSITVGSSGCHRATPIRCHSNWHGPRARCCCSVPGSVWSSSRPWPRCLRRTERRRAASWMPCAMYSNVTRRFLLAAVVLVAGAGGARAPNAPDIIAGADRIRNPAEPFRTTSVLTEYVQGKPKDRTVLTVYSKEDKATGQFRNLVRYVEPPRDAGKMALLDGQNLWFYDPAAKSSVRISTQQRLVGL